MLRTDKNKIEDITFQDIDNFYYTPARQEDWYGQRTEVRADQNELPDFSREELDNIIEKTLVHFSVNRNW